MTLYSYMIGTAAGGTAGMVNLESLTTAVSPPKSSYTPNSKPLPLGNGEVRGGGWIEAQWHWDHISRAQRDQLRSFCTTASAEVYIKTRKNDSLDTYANFKAVMVWPQEEEKEAGRRIDFILLFRRLEAA